MERRMMWGARLIISVAVLFSVHSLSAAEAVSVRTNFLVGAEHSFLFLGKEKGWFADAGIDLEIVPGQGSTVSVKTVAAGEATFAIADVATVARAWEAGLPIVVAAVLLKESPTTIYSLKTKGIEKMTDLCGKRIGVNIKSTTAEQYRGMLKAAKLDCTVTEVPATGGGGKEILTGGVDAAVGFSYEYPTELESKGIHMNQILASQFYSMYSLSIITSADTAVNKKPLVDAFLTIVLKSIRYGLAHPDEAKQAFLRTAPSADVAYENMKYDLFTKLLVSDDPSGGSIGQSDLTAWKTSLSTLKTLGLIHTDIDPVGKFIALAKSNG
jgi:NitT/TauT family transport system substrate-binding protein